MLFICSAKNINCISSIKVFIGYSNVTFSESNPIWDGEFLLGFSNIIKDFTLGKECSGIRLTIDDDGS